MARINPARAFGLLSFMDRHERISLLFAGTVVGCFSGVAAAFLNHSIGALYHFLEHFREHFWAFALPGAGAALSSLWLSRITREGGGHGVPEVIYSVSRRGGFLRFRASFSRLISSCLTIGSGGSAGPEAPVVMSGAAIGSNIATLLRFPSRHRVTLVGCGAAAAIASIFNAPIAGIVFTLEVILGEWTAVNIIPIGVSAVAGTQVGRALMGNRIPFDHAAYAIDLGDILASVGLALVAALASVWLSRMIRKSHHLWERLPVPRWNQAFLGGCLVGIIGLCVPSVLGEGYEQIQSLIHGQFASGLWLVGVAAILKMVATAVTLGSGGSGGIFAPGLVVGSFLGATYGRLLHAVAPAAGWAPEGCYALLGMAGIMAGMLQAPLTGIFLIVEVTGDYGVILPLIIVSALSAALCRWMESGSFYLKDLQETGALLRPGTDARVLEDLRVAEVLEHDCISLTEDMTLGEFVEVLKRSHRNHFPVVEGETGRFVGMLDLDRVRPVLFTPELYSAVLMGEIMEADPMTVSPADRLPDILDLMERLGVFSLPVVSEGQFLGMISKGTLLDRYRKELIVQTAR